MYYSIHWELVSPQKWEPNILHIQTTFINPGGGLSTTTRKYRDWFGVCTKDIQKVLRSIRSHFPRHPIHHQYLGPIKKYLPYFKDRLRNGKLDYTTKSFYKISISTNLVDVANLLNQSKVAYVDPNDWKVRLYIDLGTLYQTQGFYYKWYHIEESEWLMTSFRMLTDKTDAPPWTIAAFDLETVPRDGATDRIPTGTDEEDQIVMISLHKWNPVQKRVLYLKPRDDLPDDEYESFTSEKDLLIAFHEAIRDVHVLTGYNIQGFDLPCLLARCWFLDLKWIVQGYSSKQIGQDIVVTFRKKIVLDLYPYFRIFSNYDLPSFKLDDVARVKLQKNKIPVKSTGIWAWYTRHPTLEMLRCTDVETCFRALRPTHLTLDQFGTFRQYLEYCDMDSHLVHQLFEKEMVLPFLLERANFTALDVMQALHMGNSNYLMELFKTYGTRLGFFTNALLRNDKRSASYQGALNFCVPETFYENVSVMDFTSMYPSTLLSSNLCYGTCALLTREEWLACPTAQRLRTVPYRLHDDRDFETDTFDPDRFRYPSFGAEECAIVINPDTEGFLPCLVKHFLELRKQHQAFKGDVYHHNAQLCIKILINSLYGIMGNKDSKLAYLPIAMAIVTLSRYQLLGSYHFLRREGYTVCYADTDSLMVQGWGDDHCDAVNAYLGLPHVHLKYEKRMKKLLILSKKRYVYETMEGGRETKGFQKRTNELVEFISKRVLDEVWESVFGTRSTPTQGWILWAELLQEADYRCRDPKKYSIYRKTKPMADYKSKTCAAYRLLEKYPDRENKYIEYTYSRADVSQRSASKWVMDAEECQWVNFEQLFMSQRKIFCLLLNMGFWGLPTLPTEECDMVANTLRWKKFVHSELLFWFRTRKKVMVMVQRGVKYTFCLNDHVKRKRGRIRQKSDLRLE